MEPKISIITPTFRRHPFLTLLSDCVAAQSYRNYEWLVFDDTGTPFEPLAHAADDRVRYIHAAERMTIGAKRNEMAAMSTGDVIVLFDDDDYYAPGYLQTIANAFQTTDNDFLNLRGFFVHHCERGVPAYWNLTQPGGPLGDRVHYRFEAEGISRSRIDPISGLFADLKISYCFGYSFRREVWDRFKFPDQNWRGDLAFSKQLVNDCKMGGIYDNSGLSVHFIHKYNTSRCFPQYLIPDVLFRKYFRGLNVADYARAGDEVAAANLRDGVG